MNQIPIIIFFLVVLSVQVTRSDAAAAASASVAGWFGSGVTSCSGGHGAFITVTNGADISTACSAMTNTSSPMVVSVSCDSPTSGSAWMLNVRNSLTCGSKNTTISGTGAQCVVDTADYMNNSPSLSGAFWVDCSGATRAFSSAVVSNTVRCSIASDPLGLGVHICVAPSPFIPILPIPSTPPTPIPTSFVVGGAFGALWLILLVVALSLDWQSKGPNTALCNLIVTVAAARRLPLPLEWLRVQARSARSLPLLLWLSSATLVLALSAAGLNRWSNTDGGLGYQCMTFGVATANTVSALSLDSSSTYSCSTAINHSACQGVMATMWFFLCCLLITLLVICAIVLLTARTLSAAPITAVSNRLATFLVYAQTNLLLFLLLLWSCTVHVGLKDHYSFLDTTWQLGSSWVMIFFTFLISAILQVVWALVDNPLKYTVSMPESSASAATERELGAVTLATDNHSAKLAVGSIASDADDIEVEISNIASSSSASGSASFAQSSPAGPPSQAVLPLPDVRSWSSAQFASWLRGSESLRNGLSANTLSTLVSKVEQHNVSGSMLPGLANDKEAVRQLGIIEPLDVIRLQAALTDLLNSSRSTVPLGPPLATSVAVLVPMEQPGGTTPEWMLAHFNEFVNVKIHVEFANALLSGLIIMGIMAAIRKGFDYTVLLALLLISIVPYLLSIWGRGCFKTCGCIDDRLYATVQLVAIFFTAIQMSPIMSFQLAMSSGLNDLINSCKKGVSDDEEFWKYRMPFIWQTILALWTLISTTRMVLFYLRLPFLDVDNAKLTAAQFKQLLYNELNLRHVPLLGIPLMILPKAIGDAIKYKSDFNTGVPVPPLRMSRLRSLRLCCFRCKYSLLLVMNMLTLLLQLLSYGLTTAMYLGLVHDLIQICNKSAKAKSNSPSQQTLGIVGVIVCIGALVTLLVCIGVSTVKGLRPYHGQAAKVLAEKLKQIRDEVEHRRRAITADAEQAKTVAVMSPSSAVVASSIPAGRKMSVVHEKRSEQLNKRYQRLRQLTSSPYYLYLMLLLSFTSSVLAIIGVALDQWGTVPGTFFHDTFFYGVTQVLSLDCRYGSQFFNAADATGLLKTVAAFMIMAGSMGCASTWAVSIMLLTLTARQSSQQAFYSFSTPLFIFQSCACACLCFCALDWGVGFELMMEIFGSYKLGPSFACVAVAAVLAIIIEALIVAKIVFSPPADSSLSVASGSTDAAVVAAAGTGLAGKTSFPPPMALPAASASQESFDPDDGEFQRNPSFAMDHPTLQQQPL